VRGEVAFSEVGFGFDDASGERAASRFADQEFSEQLSRHMARIAVEEDWGQKLSANECSHGGSRWNV
jgi:hypothetical protein